MEDDSQPIDGAEGGAMPETPEEPGVGLGVETANVPPAVEAQPEPVLEPTEADRTQDLAQPPQDKLKRFGNSVDAKYEPV